MLDDVSVFGNDLVPWLMAMLGAISLAGLRLLPIFFLLAPFNLAGMQAGLLRGGIIFSLSLFFIPMLWQAALARPHPMAAVGDLPIFFVIGKELFIGLVLAFALNMPFWIADGLGAIIDTQSGEQLGGMVNPGTGEETTANGIFLSLVAMAVLLEAGFFSHVLMPILADSYAAWPIDAMGPATDGTILTFFMRMFSGLIYTALVIAMPFLIGMVLIDIGLAYASRFVPTLSPFFLSMGAKVLMVSVLLLAYHQMLVRHFLGLMAMFDGLIPRLGGG